MSLLDARALVKSYGPRTVLDGVDLSIHAGDRIGLVGHNGCGKSTLGRILAGVELPDTGELALRRETRVMHLAQEPVLDPALPVLEQVLAGQTEWWEAKRRHDEVSAALAAGEGELEAGLAKQADAGADLERLGGWEFLHHAETLLNKVGITEMQGDVTRMSGGERRRVALARILVSAPDLAIMDEPTNHLDVETVEWLEDYLAREFTGSLLLITHDRYVLDRVATKTIELERGRAHRYDGGYGRYLEAKAERLALDERTEANRQNFLRREVEWLRRGPKARTTKQKARIQRAHAAIANKPAAARRQVKLEQDTVRTGKTILELDGVRLDTPDGARTLVRDLSFYLTKGDRLGIVGRNGTGKTTLLRAILGEHEVAAGKITRGQNTEIAYLSQMRDGLDEEASVRQNVAGDRAHVHIGGQDVNVRGYLERFLFRGTEQDQPIGSLSGGERTRVALAKLLQQASNLLVLDEPTNDLDVETLGAIESLIAESEQAALVVTHDRWFLDRVVTAVLFFEGDEAATRYEGGYTEAREQREAAKRATAVAKKVANKDAPKAVSAPRVSSGKPKSGLSYKEARELEGIEAEIDALEAKLADLDQTLSDPAMYQERGDEIPSLTQDRDAAQLTLEEKMNRWAELEERREG